jgi:hypothetical protein
MIRLGHIDYSNCVPVHARLLEAGGRPHAGARRAVRAEPRAGRRRDRRRAVLEHRVRPHAGEYRILPGHAIGSYGAVQSILLESSVPLAALDGRDVAVPTASATSVVLLRACSSCASACGRGSKWYDQAAPSDPVATDAAAVLRIGDVALRRRPRRAGSVYDLGAEWTAWTGLPFAFAVWQVRRDLPDAECDGWSAAARVPRLVRRARTIAGAAVRTSLRLGRRGCSTTGRRCASTWTPRCSRACCTSTAGRRARRGAAVRRRWTSSLRGLARRRLQGAGPQGGQCSPRPRTFRT